MSQIGVSNTVIHCRHSYIELYKEIETLAQRHTPPVVRSSEVSFNSYITAKTRLNAVKIGK